MPSQNWTNTRLETWGRVYQSPAFACSPATADTIAGALADSQSETVIAYGNGRSYGDAPLNSNGRVIVTNAMNAIHTFDEATGTLICDAGTTFRQLIDTFLNRGFFVPVTPGTSYATLGGAIANDVHGKNHESAGSFGDHVDWFDLVLPSGEVVQVDRHTDPDLFAATVGGVGLTGVITRICIKLRRIPSNSVNMKEVRIRDIDEFFAAFEQVRKSASYSVGWIDAIGSGGTLGRGILETAENSNENILPSGRTKSLRIPFEFPNFALNSYSIQAFNELYYRRIPASGRERHCLIDRFMYPLDAILQWNKIYGKRGFYQFQCVFPEESSARGIVELLRTIRKSRGASFLAVLKTLGSEGLGCLSFPRSGYTLALDFPRRAGVEDLFSALEKITLENGGRIYLAKDLNLSASAFRAMYPRYPRLVEVLERIDPQKRMQSDMSRRLQIR